MKIVTDLSVTSAPHRARHGWHPGWLFRNGTQGAWFDPSDLTTLFQDITSTVPVVADGDPVALMLDKSGNGNHATQQTAAARPTWRTDGQLAWLEFDGVDDRMAIAGATFPDAALAICAGMRCIAAGNAWGSVRSRTETGIYAGLSNPTATGPISNTGGQIFVNRALAPNDRIALRNLLLSPKVVTVRDAQASAFSGHPWQFVSYWNIAPPPARLFAYVEVNADTQQSLPILERWVGEKTGVAL